MRHRRFGRESFHSQVDSIFFNTPISVPFSNAAATRSLSPSCLLTASSVLWVPFLMRTSMRKRGGRACSRRTRTPKPMTVASEQWVIVGVISTTTVLMEDRGETGGRIWISGRFTTASEPSDRGCSGSEMVEMRSAVNCLARNSTCCLALACDAYRKSPVHRCSQPHHRQSHWRTEGRRKGRSSSCIAGPSHQTNLSLRRRACQHSIRDDVKAGQKGSRWWDWRCPCRDPWRLQRLLCQVQDAYT